MLTNDVVSFEQLCPVEAVSLMHISGPLPLLVKLPHQYIVQRFAEMAMALNSIPKPPFSSILFKCVFSTSLCILIGFNFDIK